MLTEAEAEARRRGCRHAMVETSSFQAPEFYRRHGYQEFGRIAFTLPGQARVFLRKRLDRADTQATVAAAYATGSHAVITFDPVRDTDADAMLEMARAFHAEENHPITAAGEAAVRQIARGEPIAPAWIMRRGARAIGYVVITLGFSIEYGGRDRFIDELYLIPEVRGCGLGRRLLDFALVQAGQIGIGTLHLEVESGNEHAGRLYRSGDFAETGRGLMRLRLGSGDAPAA